MGWDLGAFISGIPDNHLLYALLIILASIVVARVVHFLFRKYIEVHARRTKTTLDDRIVSVVDVPLFLLIISGGVYIALLIIPAAQPFLPVLDRIFVGFWILLGTILALRLGEQLLEWYGEEIAPRTKRDVREILPTLKRIWQVAIILIGLVMLLGNFGIEVTPLVASLGIAGLAIALAFQDTLANFFAGIYITADRPIETGDYVKLDTGDEGYVVKIGWRSTQIRTLPNNTVVIPNAKLAQSVITNYYKPSEEMGVVIPLSVAYGSDLEKVEKIVVEEARKVLRSTQGGVKGFEPFLRYNTFGDSGIKFAVILKVEKFVDKFLVTHEFIKAVHKRFEKEGIEIPFPKSSVYIEKIPEGRSVYIEKTPRRRRGSEKRGS